MSSEPLVENPNQQTVYEIIGGAETIERLVEDFYSRIEQDDLLRPLFPEDLEPGKHYQALFLIQYWGGPAAYRAERGHPRLRMRHAPVEIGQAECDAWLNHMLDAIDAVEIPEPARAQMIAYFERAATFMINI